MKDTTIFGLSTTWLWKLVLHVGLLVAAFLCAYQLRRMVPFDWWLTEPDAVRVVRWAALFGIIGGFIELIFQTERMPWRFASVRDAVALARSVTLTTALFILVAFTWDRGTDMPRSILPLAWVLSLVFLLGARLAWRLRREARLSEQLLPSWWRRRDRERLPILLIGGMDASDRQLRHLLADPNQTYQPIGVITPYAEELGLNLHGVPFIATVDEWRQGWSPLPRKSEEVPALLFLSDPATDLGLTPQHVGELKKAGHKMLRPSILTEVGEPKSAASALMEIPLEEFLPRKPIRLEASKVHSLIRGRRVLITGAGGSIGSEIARQMAQYGCGHLTLLDHSEFLLFEIDRELASVDTGMTRRAVLANVRDADRIKEIIAEEKPDIVFHAAALKHVTLVEQNPAEGVLTNVLGTWNVMQASLAQGVRQFVLISTDKAVDPTNTMGATKRIAETLLNLVPAARTHLSAVRFGNVLGSAGSVVPIFRDQIARGGPVTVTHRDVNRYFMTIPEAVELVLHSAAIKAEQVRSGPSKYLLEMGEPVRIADLARQMIELSGLTPDEDIKIEFTGLKKGEKVSEVLVDTGETAQACLDGILEIAPTDLPAGVSEPAIMALVERARQRDNGAVADEVMTMIGLIRAH